MFLPPHNLNQKSHLKSSLPFWSLLYLREFPWNSLNVFPRYLLLNLRYRMYILVPRGRSGHTKNQDLWESPDFPSPCACSESIMTDMIGQRSRFFGADQRSAVSGTRMENAQSKIRVQCQAKVRSSVHSCPLLHCPTQWSHLSTSRVFSTGNQINTCCSKLRHPDSVQYRINKGVSKEQYLTNASRA